MSNYRFRDTGEPVPSFNEMLRLLGPDLSAIVEQRIQQLNQASCPLRISTLNGYLQGLYNAAVLLGHIDRRLGRAMCDAVMASAGERLKSVTAGDVGKQHINDAVKRGVH